MASDEGWDCGFQKQGMELGIRRELRTVRQLTVQKQEW